MNDWYTINGHYNLSDNREVMGVSPESYKRDGAFAEFVSVPQHILYKIPENVEFEQAAMVELIAMALHAIRKSNIQPADSCVIVGAGMVGIQIVKLLSIFGASKIIVIDINKKNLQNATDLGADACFLPDEDNLVKKSRILPKDVALTFRSKLWVNVKPLISRSMLSARGAGWYWLGIQPLPLSK